MDSEKIAAAVQALVEDYQRAGNYLSRETIERVISKRKLTTHESIAVYDALIEKGIHKDDIEDEQTLDENDDSAEKQQAIEQPAEVAQEAEESSALSILRRRAERAGLLSADEERELGRKIALAQQAKEERVLHQIADQSVLREIIKAGEHAKIRFLECNIRLVIDIAWRYGGITDLSIDDLIQEGMLGLIRAIEKYDYQLGFKFSTYATWWIRQSIARGLADKGRTVRLPVHVAEKVAKIRKTERTLARYKGGREPTIRELSEELEWEPEYIQFLQHIAQTCVSLNQPVAEEESAELGDLISGHTPTPEEITDLIDRSNYIQSLLNSLTDREQDVIRMRYGLDGSDGKTLEEVGQKFNVTRERIRQIQAKVLRNLSKRIAMEERDLWARFPD